MHTNDVSMDARLTRRGMLRLAGYAAGAGLVAGLLAACAPQAPAAPTAGTTAAPAQPAGTSAATGASQGSATWQTILDAGKKEGRVTMYGSLLSSDESAKLAQPFKAQTGIDLDFLNILGGPATTRIREEIKANKAPDIFEGSGGWVYGLVPEGVYVPLKDKPLPVWSDPDSAWYIHPGYKSPNDWQFVLSRFRPRGGHILVNTNMLKAADYPKSWHELATDPKYKGTLVDLDPTATSGLSNRVMMDQYVGKALTAADVWGLEAGQDTLLLNQNKGNQSSVAQGERAISVDVGDEFLLNLISAGAPVKNLYFPDTPYWVVTADMGVLKAAQHPNAALVFINWYLSKEGQDAISTLQSVTSLRRDVPDRFSPALQGEVVGGGQRGPMLVPTPQQTQFGSDIQAAGIFKLLVNRASQQDYVSAYDAFVKDWEAKNGGPQDKPQAVQA